MLRLTYEKDIEKIVKGTKKIQLALIKIISVSNLVQTTE